MKCFLSCLKDQHLFMAFKVSRTRVASLHFCCSLLLAVAVALLVFGLWYPYPYQKISGGMELFIIVMGVDVVLGPLITLIVFNKKKSCRELIGDFSAIAALQIMAVCYGVWVLSEARPVHLAFEIDRFRVIHVADVPSDLIARTPVGIKALPLTGPTLVAVRQFADSEEELRATLVALQGISLGARPDLWERYDKAQPRVLAASKSLSNLIQKFPERLEEITQTVRDVGRPLNSVVYLPLVGRKDYWTVLLDSKTAEVLAFLPLDSF